MKTIILILMLAVAVVAADQSIIISQDGANWVFSKPKPKPEPTKEEVALAAKHIKAMRDDASITNVVNALIKDGTLCTIRGHQWLDGCSYGPGCLVLHTVEMRHCDVCKKQQTRSSEWK